MLKDVVWMPQEDQIIVELASKSQLTPPLGNNFWLDVAEKLAQLQFSRTPKQCQQRWNCALRPGLSKEAVWTESQLQELFALQDLYGNKWTLIASKLQAKSESQVKNSFYSTLRKAIRFLNAYINAHRAEPFFKGKKIIKETSIAKIVAQDQGKVKKIKSTRSDLPKLAKEIKTNLLLLSKDQTDPSLIKKVVLQLTDFNRNCRKMKAKRAKGNNSSFSDQSFTENLRLKKNHKSEKTPNNNRDEAATPCYSDDSGVQEYAENIESNIKHNPPPLVSHNRFWVDEALEQSLTVHLPNQEESQLQEKKDVLTTQPTRDVPEEEEQDEDKSLEEQEKGLQEEGSRGRDFLWDDLPIDGILNFPPLDNFIKAQMEGEDKGVNPELIMFRYSQEEREHSDIEKDMDYEVECPFNEYFN